MPLFPQLTHPPRPKSGPKSFPIHTNAQGLPKPTPHHASLCSVPGRLQALQAGHSGWGAQVAAGRRGGEPVHQRASVDRWGSSAGTHMGQCNARLMHPSLPRPTENQWVTAGLLFPKPSEAPKPSKVRLSIIVASQDSTMAHGLKNLMSCPLGLNTNATEQKSFDTIYFTTETVSPEKRLFAISGKHTVHENAIIPRPSGSDPSNLPLALCLTVLSSGSLLLNSVG